MALRSAFATFFLFAVVLRSSLGFSASQFVRGKVSCSDCDNNFDFSGIKIMISCNQKIATTDKSGMFTAELPSKIPSNCLAKLHGGPAQLYASRNNIASKIVKIYDESDSYVLSSPLIFSISCPSSLRSQGKCNVGKSIGSSKTVDLPVPPEWGLAPTSYYVPFLPIIGIP